MAIDPRISLGVQPLQIDNPLAQYGQVQNVLAAQAQRQAAGTQNELAQAHLAQTRITVQQAQEAQDVIGKIMAEAKKNGAPTDDPMQAAIQMSQHPNAQVQAVGLHMLQAYKTVQEYKQQAQFMQDQSPNALATQPQAAAAPQYQETPAFGATGRAAPAEPAAAISAPNQQNKLVAPTANANAMAAQPTDAQSLAAQIQSGDKRYGTAPGWAKQRELLIEQYKQLIKPEVMHVVDKSLVSPTGKVVYEGKGSLERMEVPQTDGTIKYYTFDPRTGKTSEINAPGAATGMSSPNVRAQELKLQQDKFEYEKEHPGSTVHTVVNDDGTTSLLAVGKDGVATKVTLGGVEVKGVDTPAQRLMWEQENPNKEIKEVTQADGTTKLMAVNKQSGVAEPVTVKGTPLVGARYTPPTETEKLITLRDSMPVGSKDRIAVEAKINQAKEQNRISQAHLDLATKRLKEESAMGNVKPETIDMMANMFLQGLPIPTLGMGKKSADVKAQIYNRAQELSKGTSPADTAANLRTAKQDVTGQTATIKDFSAGQAAKKVTANNTALNHLATMDKLADDLANSDTRVVNLAANAFAKATGSSAPSNFDAAKQLVAGEVMKAVTANGGGVTERQEAEKNITSSNSPEQLRGVIKTYKELLGGQLSSLGQQYETGSGRKDFNTKLSPATRELLKQSAPPAAPAGVVDTNNKWLK